MEVDVNDYTDEEFSTLQTALLLPENVDEHNFVLSNLDGTFRHFYLTAKAFGDMGFRNMNETNTFWKYDVVLYFRNAVTLCYTAIEPAERIE